uniref:Uncharacterized protein n=1 Tax=Tanacetum cinerariifolium TaxID=118510 RepID=A0A699SCF6_TANCI|nr:hypothetical protein [Tanacetum cinerariifolium]
MMRDHVVVIEVAQERVCDGAQLEFLSHHPDEPACSENLSFVIRCFDPGSGPKLANVGNIDSGIDSQSVPDMGGLNKIHYLVKVDVVLILL